MKRSLCAGLLAGLLLPVQALAWGGTGHTMINRIAAQTLPASLPAFVRAPDAVATIAYLGPEADRIKGAGTSSDDDRDPGHYADVGDDGTIFGVDLHAMPKDMEGYGRALAAGGSDPYRAGYLPYSVADGFELIRADFAMWRAFDYLAEHAAPADRATFAAWRDRRARLTIHDIGVWGHFVGDASQPLHVTWHFNGWGKYPNPNGYTDAHIHAHFEGAFVRENAKEDAVAKLVGATQVADAGHLLSQSEIMGMVGTYLLATNAQVRPLYEIEKAHGFDDASPQAVAFVDARLADGAREMRDLIVAAWSNSTYAEVGYPVIPLRDILDGSSVPAPYAFGGD